MLKGFSKYGVGHVLGPEDFLEGRGAQEEHCINAANTIIQQTATLIASLAEMHGTNQLQCTAEGRPYREGRPLSHTAGVTNI